MRRAKQKDDSEFIKVIDLPPCEFYLSTGCTVLDLAIAGRLPGGFGAGRISHVWGPESSGKSVLVAEPLGSALRQGGRAYLVDTEGTFDMVRAVKYYGVDTKRLAYLSGAGSEEDMTIEEFFDTVVKKELGKVDSNVPSVIGLDSLSALTCIAERDMGLDEPTYSGERAKALSRGFRKYIWQLAQANLGIVCVDQVRQTFGYGSAYTFSCGEPMKFYASTRVFIKIEKRLVETDNAERKRTVGTRVFFKVEKNKIFDPYEEGTFRFLFNYGIDDVGTCLEYLKDTDPDPKVVKGSHFVGPSGKRRYLRSAIAEVEEEGTEKELIKMVYDRWQILHPEPDRKERIRC